MRETNKEEMSMTSGYFVPHHPVIKEDSFITKVRIVFYASCKSSNRFSLNDCMVVGPTIQSDLFCLITQWRLKKIAISADIEKMYRQIWLEQEDSLFQKNLWRDEKTQAVKQYVIQTVVFGNASAPFQAIRTSFEIANRIESSQPETARIIRENFYVDDFLLSVDSIEEALEVRQHVSKASYESGVRIQKKIMEMVHKSETNEPFCVGMNDSGKALEISWCPRQDIFSFQFKNEHRSRVCTKRHIASEIAKNFDPLGWLSPSLVNGKILLQKLWKTQLKWDDIVPEDLTKELLDRACSQFSQTNYKKIYDMFPFPWKSRVTTNGFNHIFPSRIRG